MKNISIVIPLQGALISSIVRLFKIFNEANEYELQKARPIPFCVNFLADAEVVNLYGGHYTLKPVQQLKDISQTDLVIIPALAGNIGEGLQKENGLQQWLKKQFQYGTEIACMCTSVFLLPDTELLQKKHCVKKWFVADDFRQQFSRVNSIVENVTIHDQQIYTNGGAYSFIDGVIKATADEETATFCSSGFRTEFNRECQSLAVIKNDQRTYQREKNKIKTSPVVGNADHTVSAEDFAAMLNLNLKHHLDKVLYEYLMKANNSANKIPGDLNLHINSRANTQTYNNKKVLRQMLGKINNF